MQLKTFATNCLWAFVLTVSTWLCNAQDYDESSQLWKQLTPKQQHYLKLLPKLRVSVQADYAPLSFQHNDQYIGLGIAYLNLISKAMNISLSYQNIPNNQSPKAFNQGLVDIVLNVNPGDNRYTNVHFTQPFLDLPLNLLMRKGEYQHLQYINELKQQKLVVISDDPVTPIVKQMLPNNQFIEADNITQAFELLNNLNADVFIYPRIMLNYYINKRFITEFELFPLPAFVKAKPFMLTFISHQDNSQFNEILDIAVSLIDPQEIERIKFNWQINHTQKLMQSMQLTKEEQLALNSQPKITVGMLNDAQPFSFTDHSKHIGFTKTLVELIAVKLNINVQYHYDNWPNLMQKFKNKQIDVLTDMTDTPERRAFTLFTKPYISYKNSIVTRRTNRLEIMSINEMKKLTLVGFKGHFITEYFEQNHPKIKIHYVSTMPQAYQAIQQNKADIIIESSIRNRFFFKKYKLNGLKEIELDHPPLNQDYSHAIAVNPDRPLLRSALDKALISISGAELRQLRQRWFNVHDDISSPKFALSLEQLKWLYQVNQISVYKPNLGLPLGKWYNNQYTGVISNFVAQLEKSIGLDWFDVAHNDWQSADITIASPNNQQIAEQFNFTAPISEVPVVIITANPEQPFTDDIQTLSQSTIATIKSHHYVQTIKQLYPEAKLQPQNSLEQAVSKVSQGHADILLCPLTTCSFVINQQGASHLRIIGQTKLRYSLAFAVNKNNPMLLSIIDHLLNNISAQQKDWFHHQWHNDNVPVDENKKSQDWSILLFMLFSCLICFALYRRYLVVKRYKQAEQFASSMLQNNKNLKQAQSKLVHAEKMASLGTLTAGVAHEINNPTNFVHVGVQNLRADIIKTQAFFIELAGSDADPDIINSFKEQFIPVLEHIETISLGTQKIKVIVQDLRAFTRTDSKDKNPIELNSYIQSTVNLVTTKCVEIATIETQLGEIPDLPCHPAQINQVLMSLIVNACDAIIARQKRVNDTAVMNHETGCITISTECDQHHAIITVADNGIGMSEHTQAHLFEPFYTTKTEGEGSGLGLAMAASIISDHQGSIGIVKSSQEGTTMQFTLPLMTPDHQTSLTTKNTNTAENTAHISNQAAGTGSQQ